MKHLIFLFALSILSDLTVQAQNERIPDGVYQDVIQLQKHIPAFKVDLNIIKIVHTNEDINSSNDYELRSGIDSITGKYLKHNIYCYVKDGAVYLNCYNFGLSS